MKTPIDQQSETRFVALMSELFQMDEAQALDFGIYRVIRRHNRDIKAYLGEVVTAPDGQQTLHGGTLAQTLDVAFAASNDEALATDKFRLQEVEKQLGLKPGLTESERSARLAQAEGIPATQTLAAEYHSRSAAQVGQQTVQADRTEVLNRLYQFFARHYQDGDFIVQRRYGKGGARWVKSTGDDTEFHWATEDMYYIKSGDIFTDFDIRLSTGQALRLTIEPDSLQTTRAALKPNDKAHYELVSATRAADGLTTVLLGYHKGPQTEAQKDQIISAACQAAQANATQAGTELRRWLAAFMARNQSDFFIHKRLQEALSDDLDIYLKTELLDVDQLLVGTVKQPSDLPQRTLQVARIVRQVGRQLIDFLATLEDFQKDLWEKKKLVFETRYVITLDRLARYCPDWLAAHITAIVLSQRSEWQDLGMGDFAAATDCMRHSAGDLASPATASYLPLPVDSGRFDAEFKWSMLEAITASTGLDEALDGVAIQSDNWQALNTLQAKYREQVKCIYIDPPYNTGGDGFAYKDAYQSASWLAMMDDRLRLAAATLKADGALFSSIDQNEYPRLRTLMEATLTKANALGTIVWKNVTDNNPTNVAVEHEYVEAFAKNRVMLESEWKSPYSDAKDLLITLGKKLAAKHSDEPALQRAYQDWLKSNKEFLGPLEGYKFIDGEGIYAGSRSVHNPGKEGYRYNVIHPKTKKVCKQPLMGYRFPESTYKKLEESGRIIFGEDETKLIELKVYAHEYAAKLPSVIEIDGRSGANDLTNLFGEAQKFKNPKASALLQELLPYAAGKGDLVADFFLGSGTTLHALMRLNRKTGLGYKWLGVETSHNFDAVIVPRVKKAAFSVNWLKGQPIGADGPGLFMRIQTLEQYDDTLQNLAQDTDVGDSGDLLADVPALALSYRLDSSSRKLYLGLEHFSSPFGYELQRAAGGAAALAAEVDLVESVPYLLGLDVTRLYREPQGVVLLGRNRRAESVAVFFRDCAVANSADWVQAKLTQHPTTRIYTNNPAEFSFADCDRLESIEAVFALQFKRN